MAEHPSTLRRDHPPQVSLTLLAVLCWCRLAGLTDSLVELFVALVRAINTRAERRVDKEQIAEFRRVGDKENVLFTLADVSLAHPTRWYARWRSPQSGSRPSRTWSPRPGPPSHAGGR